MGSRVLALILISAQYLSSRSQASADEFVAHPLYRVTVASNEFGEDQLVTYDLEGKAHTRFESRGRRVGSPAWSPDATQIAFDGDGSIFVLDADGSNERLLLGNHPTKAQPCWSPDGRQIAYVQVVPGEPNEIWMVGVDGTGSRRLAKHATQHSDCPAWAPDGRTIALSRWPGTLMLCDSDGSSPRELFPSVGSGHFPAWCADKSAIAFHADRVGSAQLMIGDPARNRVRQLTDRGTNRFPAWSPDGRYLAYVHFDIPPPAEPRGDLVVFDVVSETSKTIVRGSLPAGASGHARPAWKPMRRSQD